MEIRINDKTLDIKLDTENTLGDVLSGLGQWLGTCGHRISELIVDGSKVKSSMIEEIFSKDVKLIQLLDIYTQSTAELTAASLLNLLEDIEEYENLDHDKKSEYFNKWKESAAALFLCAELKDLYAFCVSVFSDGSMDTKTLTVITEEIQREVNDPVSEITKIEPILIDICDKLIELPLDIQTGKDSKAANTIQIFTAVTDKIIRIFRQLCIQGYILPDSISADDVTLNELIINFGKILKDLLDAYEKNDTVLVGDLTEYEASPMLKEIYTAILENIVKQAESKNNDKTSYTQFPVDPENSPPAQDKS